MKKLINISQLAIALKLVDPKSNKPLNYILRYWEKEFKQIRPKIINKRRYYSEDQLDDYNSNSLKASYLKLNLRAKSKKILDKLNKIKKYGKKNSS